MGTRNAIVKGIDAADIAGIRTAVTNNNGSLKSAAANTEQMCDFPTDADGAAFEVDVIALGYVIASWDLYCSLKQDRKVS